MQERNVSTDMSRQPNQERPTTTQSYTDTRPVTEDGMTINFAQVAYSRMWQADVLQRMALYED